MTTPIVTKDQSLKSVGLENLGRTHWNLTTPELYEEAIRRHEGVLSHLGPLVVRTGQHTGRLPHDKFIVREPSSEGRVGWGKVNVALDSGKFELLHQRLCAYLQAKDLFIQDCYVGADEHYRLPIRIVTEHAWQSLFARNMFIREFDPVKLARHTPEFTVICAPHFQADPLIDGTHSEAFIILNFGRKLIIIGGTAYAGEIKKSIFTVMNYLLPQKGVMAMHSSSNYGKDRNDVVVFFGLSGTGKTTLSADPERTLIGDDEHGWSDDGIFNFEGGCYAKMVKLSPKEQPEIYDTTRRFGTILENVGIDARTRHVDLDDISLTENTRGAYPISDIENMTLTGTGGHPKNIIMLTCDAFGVLPPVARLTHDQALYHFLSGYTAKVAGTEAGIKEPQATFSPCFGAPFMPLPPSTYARLLGEKIIKYKVQVWLINTGWSGGPYGEGQRMHLDYTRAMITGILGGSLNKATWKTDAIFGLSVPDACTGVPADILQPRQTWKSPTAYDKKALELAGMFTKNFLEVAPDASAEIKAAAPKVS